MNKILEQLFCLNFGAIITGFETTEFYKNIRPKSEASCCYGQ